MNIYIKRTLITRRSSFTVAIGVELDARLLFIAELRDNEAD